MPLSPVPFWIVSSTIAKSSQSRVKATEWLQKSKSNNHQRSSFNRRFILNHGFFSNDCHFRSFQIVHCIILIACRLFIQTAFRLWQNGFASLLKNLFILFFSVISSSYYFAGNRMFPGHYPLSGTFKCRKSGTFKCRKSGTFGCLATVNTPFLNFYGISVKEKSK